MSQFEQDTAVERVAENRWRGEFHPGVRIGTAVNGGYVLAVIGRALQAALPHRDPLSINAFYLAPTALGSVDIIVEPLQSGRGTSFASASLYQEGQLKVRATAAYTDLEQLRGEDWTGDHPPSSPAFADTRALEQGFLEIHDRIDIRLTAGQELFETGTKPGTGKFVAWLRHQDGADIDSVDLLMFADIMPPPPFSLFGAFGWVPTVELTVQCRRKPVPGPLLGRLVSRHLTSGIIEADGDFWDSEGHLVALSRQTMKVRLPG